MKLIPLFYPLQPPESTATIYATWTPKHNGVLKTCMASGAQKEVETDQEYLARIVKSWRSKFPKSSVLDEDLIKRIKDLINGGISGDDKSTSVEPPASKKAKIAGVSVSKVKIEAEIDPESLRMPNSRGQMNWNKIAINDLLECHLLAQEVFMVFFLNIF